MPGFDGYEVVHNNDGSVTFTCKPTNPGLYTITVEHEKVPLKGLPMCFDVQETTQGFVTVYISEDDIDFDLSTAYAKGETPAAATVHRAQPPQTESTDKPSTSQTPDAAVPEAQVIPHRLQAKPGASTSVVRLVKNEDPRPMETDPRPMETDEEILIEADEYLQLSDEDSDADSHWASEIEDEDMKDFEMDIDVKSEVDEGPSDSGNNLIRSMKISLRSSPRIQSRLQQQAALDGDEEEADKEDEVDEEGMFVCEMTDCEKMFDRKSDFKEHCKTVHGHYMCDEKGCSMTFKYKSSLGIHLQRAHKAIICKTHGCRKKFKSEEALRLHRTLKHKRRTKYCCHICGKEMMTQEHLRGHIRTHSDQQPFECNEAGCHKRFKSKQALTSHMVNHGYGKISCPVCNKKFAFQNRLDRHLSVHRDAPNNSEMITCVYCEKKLMKYNLKNHLKKVHETEYKCPECWQTFYTDDEQANHDCSGPVNEDTPVCQICEEAFSDQMELACHMENHFPKNQCEICDQMFKTAEGLRKHKRVIHAREKVCCVFDDCGKMYKTQKLLDLHVKRVHYKSSGGGGGGGGKFHPCDVCDYVGKSKFKLERHSLRHSERRDFVCDICGKCLKSSDTLRVHRKETHYEEMWKLQHDMADGDNKEGLLQPLPRYQCPHCFKGFKRMSHYNHHVAAHEQDNQVPCPREGCHKVFRTIHKMKDHVRTVHSASQPVPCEFPGCTQIFKKASSMKAHLRKHQKVNFECSVSECGLKFTTKHSMMRHYQLNHTELDYNFNCPYESCPKRFRLKDQLQQHLKSHVNQKDIPCPECDKLFKSRNAMQNHVKIHYKEMQYMCVSCGKYFPRKYRLNEHLLKHHDAVMVEIVQS